MIDASLLFALKCKQMFNLLKLKRKIEILKIKTGKKERIFKKNKSFIKFSDLINFSNFSSSLAERSF